MEKVLRLLCIGLFIIVCTGCRDTLWFQASILSNIDELTENKNRDEDQAQHTALIHLASRLVNDASECARLCYLSTAPVCNSAIFEQRNDLTIEFGSNYWCRLMTTEFPCAPNRHLISSIDQNGLTNKEPILLHCFYCNRFAGGVREKETTKNEGGGLDSEEEKDINRALTTEIGAKIEEFSVGNEGSTWTGPTTTTSKFLRVMTFNTWIAGNNVRDGISKIANHIFINDPHVVALQELDEYSANRLRTNLNVLYQQAQRSPNVWYHCRRNFGGLNHILTRFPIDQEYNPSIYLKNNGCKIRINEQPPKYVHLWNLHLHWEDYGPYAACNSHDTSTNLPVQDLMMNSEYKPKDPSRSRLHQTLRFLHHRQLKDFVASHHHDGDENDQKSKDSLILILGDFNSPSHLDWTSRASNFHCNITYEWPVSKLIADFGFSDSFRKLHSDPFLQPGFTWSPIYKTKTWLSETSTELEPQDRIDFIYYLNSYKNFKIKQSIVYRGSKLLSYFPHHYDNDWPSDHASVVSEFELSL